MFKRKDGRIPSPGVEAVKALVSEHAPVGFEPPQWLVDLIVIAYQNGRYDEASAETFSAALS